VLLLMRSTLNNPIALREWRSLRRRTLDWRRWLGLQWVLDPTAWGAPALLLAALLPFALAWVIQVAETRWPMRLSTSPSDCLALVMLLVWLHVPAVSLALSATTVSGERSRQTWEQLSLTPLSGSERAIGFLLGRLGPVWISFLGTSLLWWLLYPHTVQWLDPQLPLVLPRWALVVWGLLSLALSLSAGYYGLLASARAKSMGVAVSVAALRVCVVLIVLTVAGPVPFLCAVLSQSPFSQVSGLGTVAVALWISFRWQPTWQALARALEDP
jgi:hypothetical protein